MLIFTDEDVPDAVAAFLTTRGHQVRRVRDHFARGTTDVLIAQAASELGAVVVRWNARHFKALARKKRADGRLRYPGMSLIVFTCSHVHGLPRLQNLIAEIEAVSEIRVGRVGTRMIADISDTVLRFED